MRRRSLASVVRRIGRLGPDKPRDCAAESARVSRRTTNGECSPRPQAREVRLDGAGKIRITDFWLASIARAFRAAEVRAGLPAYMAPNSVPEAEVSTKSDIFRSADSYENPTGKAAAKASTLGLIEAARVQARSKYLDARSRSRSS